MLQLTPQERLALGVTALLLTAGAGVRFVAATREPVQWGDLAGAADTVQRGAASSLRAAAESRLQQERARSVPLASDERIDPNRATADELQRLPRVGPALAARIVEWREAHGPFRTLADLDAVPGVGPATLGVLAPHLTLPAGPPSASPSAAPRLDLNRATAEELATLPGIGAVLATRIVEWREAHGPFRSVEELERVPGIGPKLRARVAPLVRVTP